MKSRDFYPSFFKDSFIVGLTPAEKMLYICYHFTADVDLLFCFAYPDREALHESGATQADLDEFKKKAEAANKILFNGDYVYLVNAHRFETLKGERIEAGRRAAFSRLPKHIQDWFNTVCPHPIHIEPSLELKSSSEEIITSSREYLLNLSPSEVSTLAEKYTLSEDKIIQEAEAAYNWIKSKGKKYTDYPAMLRNWLKKASEQPNQSRQEVPFTDLSHLGNARVERRNY